MSADIADINLSTVVSKANFVSNVKDTWMDTEANLLPEHKKIDHDEEDRSRRPSLYGHNFTIHLHENVLYNPSFYLLEYHNVQKIVTGAFANTKSICRWECP